MVARNSMVKINCNILNKVSLDRNTHKNNMHLSTSDNITARGSQEPNLVLPLGAKAQVLQFSVVP